MPLRVWLLIFLLLAGWAGVAAWSLHVERSARRIARDTEQQDLAAIQAALQRPIDFVRETLTLHEFARRIGQAAGVEVTIDEAVLLAAGIDPLTGTLRVSRSTLSCAAALEVFLLDRDLTYTLENGQIVITTPDAAESRPQLAVYPLPQPEMAGSMAGGNAWLDLVTTVVRPQDWDSVGGHGHCEAVPGALLVVQTPRVQEQVRVLLGRLSQLEDPPQSWQPMPLWPEWNNSRTGDVLAKLHRPAAIDSQTLPLDELAEFLSHEHELPILIDYRGLEDAGVNPRQPITREVSGTLESVLRSVLSELDLTISVKNGAVLVTTPDRAEENLWVAAFPVQDLIDIGGVPDFTALIDLITATVQPQSWDTVGGPASMNAVLGGWLLVLQTREMLTQIEQLLAQLRRGLSHEEHPWILATQATPAADEQITRALEQEVPLDYSSTRLIDICADLAQQTGIRIELDERPLREAHLSGEVRLSAAFPPAPLRMQLERLCSANGLTLAIQNEALLLTTDDGAESSLITRLYDVRSLLHPARGLGNTVSLGDLLEAHVAPLSWDNRGGPGSQVNYRGLLVVSQTLDRHREVAALLAGLKKVAATRRVPSSASAPSIANDGTRSVPATLDPVDAAICRRLAQPVDLDLCEAPLSEVAEELARLTGLRIRLSPVASVESPITFSAYGMTLGGALDRLLPEDWGYQVHGHELVIAPEGTVPAQGRTQFYWVADLAVPVQEPHRTPSDIVVEMIQDGGAIEGLLAENWDKSGGPGAISALPAGWIVVTADDRVHGQIEDWLHERRTGEVPQRAKELRALARQLADERKAREIRQAEMERAQRDFVERNP